jgi:hypothetical protein
MFTHLPGFLLNLSDARAFRNFNFDQNLLVRIVLNTPQTAREITSDFSPGYFFSPAEF